MRLAVFTKNRTNPAYAGARLGAERAAQRHGASVVHYVPKKADDVAEQIALIDEALAAKHDAFVFVPVHVTAMSDAIQRVLDEPGFWCSDALIDSERLAQVPGGLGTVAATRGQAQPEVHDGFWGRLFPGQIPEVVVPAELEGDAVPLEDWELRVIRTGFTDTRDTTRAPFV